MITLCLQVFYVDYGNTETVDERNIRNMEPTFMHLPFQALECFLPLDPVEGNQWSDDAKSVQTLNYLQNHHKDN